MTNPKTHNEYRRSVDLRRILLGEGILLALATAGAYLGAYFFETGFAAYFGYPREIIEIRLFTLIAAFAVIAVAVTAVAGILYLLLELSLRIPFKPITVGYGLFRHSVFGILVIALGLVILNDPPVTGFRLALAVLMLISAGLTTFLNLSDIGIETWEARQSGKLKKVGLLKVWSDLFEEREQAGPKAIDGNLLDHLATKAPFRISVGVVLWTAVVTFFLVNAAYTLSDFISSHQREFYFATDSTGTHLLIRRYGDYLVTADFDSTNQSMNQSFRLIRVDDHSYQWRPIRIPDLVIEQN